MSITKRDTILIAVLVNSGLLTFLLMTALHVEDEPIKEPMIFQEVITSIPLEREPLQVISLATEPIMTTQELPREELSFSSKPTEIKLETNAVVEYQTNNRQIAKKEELEFVEVTIKRGDALEKIARMHNVSVDEIKRLNNLTNDRLSVGKVLKIPVTATSPQNNSKPNKNQIISTNESEVTYYELKPGDNPWKLARRFNVNYEDILNLNGLDAEKARSLKPGDKIRIK